MMDHTLRTRWTADPHPLPARLLHRVQALSAASTASAAAPAVVAPESRLSAAAEAALSAIVGAPNVLTDGPSRLGRSGGLSYLDLLRWRTGGVAVPDAVILPADPEQVAEVVVACASLGVAVVPFGGGTSVVGGVTAATGDLPSVVVVDLMRLGRLVSVDPMSRLAVLQAGVRGPDAEHLLAEHGFTLGHVPQSFERATIGGFAATRSAGQASSGYGRFEDMVQGVRVATPRGEWRLGVAPASAAGPDLTALVLGSEGAFGIITEVTVRVRPRPTHTRYAAYVLDGWPSGAEAVRALAQNHALATTTRLSDVDETDVALASAGRAEPVVKAYLKARGVREPCLLILGWESVGARELARDRAKTLRVLRRHHPISLGRAPAEAWRRGRFAGPRQRDELLNAGVCVETLETATFWSSLTTLRDEAREALRDALTTPGGHPMVMCHISHAYETGASLYFTALAARSADPIAQWQRAKAAASHAITSNNLGTITHHHATGTDHAPYLPTEIGNLGVEVLAAVKQTLDPTATLNPTKLIAPS